MSDQSAARSENVWNYPRPAIAEPTSRRLEVHHRGIVLAATSSGVRTLETSHPPTYYFPPEDVDVTRFEANPRRSLCEWKGQARYFDVFVDGRRLEAAAWHYPEAGGSFAILKGYIAFYPQLFDACLVDGEKARAQEGAFYGGWITSDLVGPFKGAPGTRFW